MWRFRYRFMVMDRFGTDLQKKFEEGGKRFPRKLVLQLGLRLVSCCKNAWTKKPQQLISQLTSIVTPNTYRPGRMKANTCFLRNTQSHTSDCSVSRSEESAIRTLPHTWAHRQAWLASAAVIDRRDAVHHPSLLESMANLYIYIFFPPWNVEAYILM